MEIIALAMARYMDEDEFKRYVSVVLEKMAEHRHEQEIKSEAGSLITAGDSKKYTIEDVISTISQISPNDAKLAYEVIDDIELKTRPRALLAAVQDKVKLYKNIKAARGRFSSNGYCTDPSSIESSIDVLADEGILEDNEVEQYLSETSLLEMVIKNEVPYKVKSKDVARKSFCVGIYSWIGLNAGAAATFFSALSPSDAFAYSFLSAIITLVPSMYLSIKTEKIAERNNEQKAKESIRNFEENFGYRLSGVESMAKKFLGQLHSDNLIIENPQNEGKIIESISALQGHLIRLLNKIPDIKKDYLSLKEAESGLPVGEITKLIKGSNE